MARNHRAITQAEAYNIASDLVLRLHDDALCVRGALGLIHIGIQMRQAYPTLSLYELRSVIKRALEDERRARLIQGEK